MTCEIDLVILVHDIVLETALQGLGAKLCEYLESVNQTKWMHAEYSTVHQGVCQIRQVDPNVKTLRL